MNTAPCPFCGSLGNKSKEHRIPESWKPYFHLVSEIVHSASVAGQTRPARSSSRSQLDVQYSGICGVCNNGWMREIDEAAMARLINLAWARTIEIPPAEVVTVMRSLVRAALVTAWGKRWIGGYPDAATREFYRTRLPPAGTHVFMGFSDWIFMHAAGHHAIWPADEDIVGGVHIVAWGLERLYTVVVFPQDGGTVMAGRTAAAIRRASRGVLREVWPHRRGTRIIVPLARSAELDRAFAARVTQARALLLGDEPVMHREDPPHIVARHAGRDPTELLADMSARQPEPFRRSSTDSSTRVGPRERGATGCRVLIGLPLRGELSRRPHPLARTKRARQTAP